MRLFQRYNPFRHPRSRELITDFFNRNYNVVIEITILPLFQKLEFFGSYINLYINIDAYRYINLYIYIDMYIDMYIDISI